MQPNSRTGGIERFKPPCPHRGDHAGEDISGTGAGQPAWCRRCKSEAPIGTGNQRIRPLVDDDRLRPACSFEGPLRLGTLDLPAKLAELALVRGQYGVMAVKAFRLPNQADAVG